MVHERCLSKVGLELLLGEGVKVEVEHVVAVDGGGPIDLQNGIRQISKDDKTVYPVLVTAVLCRVRCRSC